MRSYYLFNNVTIHSILETKNFDWKLFIKLYKQFKFVLDEARKIKHDDKIIETESFILFHSTQILITLW